jgi:hypothetical protein
MTGIEPSSDALDPLRLARVTGYSLEAWESALDAAHWIPEPALVSLVNGGAWPQLITSLSGARAAFVELGDTVKRAAEAISRFRAAYETPPTDMRGRALWLRQHRNTGPEHEPIWRHGGKPC